MKYLPLCLLAVLFCLCGCDREATPQGTAYMVAPDGTRVPMIPGNEYEFSDESDTGSGIHKYEGNAAGVGSGLDTDSEKAAQSFKQIAPNAWLPGMGSTGGTTDITNTLTGGSATSPLMWVGILCLVGAGVAFYFGLRRAALVCGGLGAAFITASMLPAWAWIVVGLAGVGAVIVYVYAERKNRLNTEALRAVVAGVEELDESTRRMVKAKVASHADAKDRVTIANLKKVDDLPSERN